MLLRFIILVCLAFCIQTVSAQSGCVKNSEGIWVCDLSISLIERYFYTYSDEIGEQAWRTTPGERTQIIKELQQFSELWCEVTLGKSRIGEISIFTNYSKSFADIALYRGVGRAYAHVGGFPIFTPSLVMYYSGLSGFDIPDPYLDRVIAHEFAHTTLKIYDEYSERGVYSASHCLHPIASDSTLNTIMGDHTRSTRFSHSQDYAGIPPVQTGQYRCYGESIWDVLLQPQNCDSDLSLRLNAFVPRQDYFAEGGSCTPSIPPIHVLESPRNEQVVRNCIDDTREKLTIEFLSNVENIVIVIDPHIDQANIETMRGALSQMMSSLAVEAVMVETQALEFGPEQRFGVVDFSHSNVPNLLDVTESNMEFLTQEVDEILNNQLPESNNMDDALNTVEMTFEANPSTISDDHNQVLIISDTDTMPSTAALSFFKGKNIPIHTIGVGDTVNPGLRLLSTETGGDYYIMVLEDNPELLDFVLRRIGHSGVNNMKEGSFTLESNEVNSIGIPVLRGSQIAIFDLSPTTPESELDQVIIRKPDHTEVDDSELSVYREGANFLAIIDAPMHGLWNVSISGNGSFDYRLRVFGPIDMTITGGTELMPRATEFPTIIYPEPIMIVGHIQSDMPILGAKVNAEITTPNYPSTPIQLVLLDDGKTPDAIVRDGIYSGAMKNYAEYGDGIYTIKVTASNPDGQAMIDDAGVATFATTATTQPETARPAPSFEITRYHQIEVKNTQVPPSNNDYNTARDIEINGTPVWGVMLQRGDTGWYRFMTANPGTYYIQTSNLHSFGNTEMATNIQLYNLKEQSVVPVDIGTCLAGETAYIANLECTLEGNTDYFVSLGYAGNDGGTYALTVSNENSLLSSFEIAQARNSDRGGSGGGSASYLLLMLLLGVLAVSTMRLLRKYSIEL